MNKEEWFTIDSIELSNNIDKLYCIEVDAPEKQFLVGDMGVPTHNTDEAKAADELKGEASMIIGSIARLGRAAGVHMVVATQRPDAKLIPGETRDNLGARVGCGTLQQSASSMLFNSNDGQRIHSNPKGGMFIQIYGKGNMGQGFFAPNDWLDKYYEKKGIDPTTKQPAGAGTQDFQEMPVEGAGTKKDNPLASWDEDMDDLINDEE